MDLFYIFATFDMVTSGLFVALIILLLFSFFFSLSEAAFLSVSRIRIGHLTRKGDKNATEVLSIISNPDKFLATVLVGNNIVNIISATIATVLASQQFGTSGPFLSGILLTVFVLIYCEMLPKMISTRYPEKICFHLARPIKLIENILFPITTSSRWFSSLLIRILGIKQKERRTVFTREELGHAINISFEGGKIHTEEKGMLLNILDFHNKKAGDIMLPIKEVAGVSVNAPLDKIISDIVDEGYTRIPLFDERKEIIGIIHAKDVLKMIQYKDVISFEDIIRQPHKVEEEHLISDIFRDMKHKRLHIAVVVNKEGNTVGILTLEDIIEEVVGEILDEHD